MSRIWYISYQILQNKIEVLLDEILWIGYNWCGFSRMTLGRIFLLEFEPERYKLIRTMKKSMLSWWHIFKILQSYYILLFISNLRQSDCVLYHWWGILVPTERYKFMYTAKLETISIYLLPSRKTILACYSTHNVHRYYPITSLK